jgi:hypothetical protein
MFMAFSTDRLPLSVLNIGASRYAHNIYIAVRERYGWYVYSLSCMYDGSSDTVKGEEMRCDDSIWLRSIKGF